MLRIGFALLGALAVVTSSVSGKAQTPTADHRWAGIVFDAFAWDTGSDLIEAWSVEDGGRIRHRRPSDGVWEFQDVHDPVRDTLHRVTFLTTGPQAGDLGWAVGQGGWVLKTTSGGAPSGSTPGWQPACPQVASQASSGDDPFEELYDVHFVNASDGWLCGKHSLWWTDNGGTTWTQVTVVDPGPPSTFLDLADFELYAVDVVDRGGSRLGLAVMEPGIVLRSDSTQSGPNLTQWQVVFDMRDLCPSGGDVNDCLNATGGVLKGCECEVCAPAGVGGPHFEPWDVEISRNEAPGMKLALFTGGIVFQCGMVFSSTDDGSTWTKDKHECECPGATGCHPIACTLDPLYNDDPSNSFDITRHKEFKTLYGLGISEGDNSAVAAGYNGQLIVRDPVSGVWQDRSKFSPAIPTTPGCVKYPMSGAEALAGSWASGSGSGFALVTGMGGTIIESTNAGETYTPKTVGDPHRTKSVYFLDGQNGWQGGQFFRIGRTASFGIDWPRQLPDADATLDHCWAIAFDPSGAKGVAVGDPFTNPVTDTPIPKIRYTLNGASTPWNEDVSVSAVPRYRENSLLDATWVTGGKFWAAGTGGLILYSVDDGKTWNQGVPDGVPNFQYNGIEGLAFVDAGNGIFVGHRPEPPPAGASIGFANHYVDQGATKLWIPIGLPNPPPPAAPNITGLYDVEVGPFQGGTSALAVAERIVGGIREGLVLRSTWSGNSFSDFVVEATFQRCVTGDELDESPVLSEIEIAPNTNDIWIGGMCGRMWVLRAAGGSWIEVQSQTSGHVTDISFGAAQSGLPFGFVNGFRTGPMQQCIIRVGN